MKKALCAGCSKAEPPKIFAPLQTPFPGAWDSQNLITWRWSLPLPTNPVWWGSMHAISSYRGNRPTNTATNPHTNRKDRLQYTVPQLAHSVINITAKWRCNINVFFAFRALAQLAGQQEERPAVKKLIVACSFAHFSSCCRPRKTWTSRIPDDTGMSPRAYWDASIRRGHGRGTLRSLKTV